MATRRAGIATTASDALAAVNPTGCFVIFHDAHHSIAYHARRTYDVGVDQFAFVSRELALKRPLTIRGAWRADRLVYLIPRRFARRGSRRQELYAPPVGRVARDGTLTANA